MTDSCSDNTECVCVCVLNKTWHISLVIFGLFRVVFTSVPVGSQSYAIASVAVWVLL